MKSLFPGKSFSKYALGRREPFPISGILGDRETGIMFYAFIQFTNLLDLEPMPGVMSVRSGLKGIVT